MIDKGGRQTNIMKRGGLTVEGVAAALRKERANIPAVARHYGVTRPSVYSFIADHPELQSIPAECREGLPRS